MIERFLCPPPFLVVLRIGHVFFGIAQLLVKRRAIEFGKRYRDLRQHRKSGIVDLGEAATNENPSVTPMRRRTRFTVTCCTSAEITSRSGDTSSKFMSAMGRCPAYAASAARRCAFSTASSMVPTM